MTWVQWITSFTACALCGSPLAPGAQPIYVFDLSPELGQACSCVWCWRGVAGERPEAAGAWARRGILDRIGRRAPRGKKT